MSDFKAIMAALLPPVAYDSAADNVGVEMAFDANAFEALFASANRLVNGLDPSADIQFIDEYERVYGLSGFGLSFSERVKAVINKISATGGLSIAYFLGIAAIMGVDITITEPQPFRADVSRAGDPLWDHDAVWVWIVNVADKSAGLSYFYASQSTAGERLLSFSPQNLEKIFNELKPAHTYCHFNYL